MHGFLVDGHIYGTESDCKIMYIHVVAVYILIEWRTDVACIINIVLQ